MKTPRPLSDHARAVLDSLQGRPIPCSEINPGVSDRLVRDGLIEQVALPSPFASHRGKNVGHWKLKAKP